MAHPIRLRFWVYDERKIIDRTIKFTEEQGVFDVNDNQEL